MIGHHARSPPFLPPARHSMRLIETPADLAAGVAHLAQADPRLAPALALDLPLRREADGFAALLRAVTGQMLSTAAAAAIWARIEAAGLHDAQALAAASDEALLGVGFSRAKLRTGRALAEAGIDWPGLRRLPDEEVARLLIALPGIGRWTADIYLLFALGRADAFAPGDLALQEAARVLLGHAERPKPAGLAREAELWRPWRGVAARALWAYYRAIKGREGVT